MIFGCLGLTFLLIFNILFILKSIGIIRKFKKNDEIYENLKNLKSLNKLNLIFFSKINFFENLIKIFLIEKLKIFFVMKLKLLNNVIMKSENFLEFVFQHFYFFTIMMMVLFHGISTFSNSFIIEVRNRGTPFFRSFLFILCPLLLLFF